MTKLTENKPKCTSVISDMDIEKAAVKKYKGNSLSEQRRNLDKILAFEEGAKWMRKMNWIKYDEQKPENGRLVLIYRDIESRQMYVTKWSDDDELYADWNEITHWCYVEYPF